MTYIEAVARARKNYRNAPEVGYTDSRPRVYVVKEDIGNYLTASLDDLDMGCQGCPVVYDAEIDKHFPCNGY